MNPACPICASRSEHRLNWRMGYAIRECSSCGLLFSTPLPSPQELAAFYQGFLHKQPAAAEIAARIAVRRAEIERLFGQAGASGRSFLDHGGGVGLAVRAATELGYDAHLHELDRESIEFAKSSLHLDDAHVVADPEPASFDCILSDNVIEHVPDPVDLLRQLARLLRPGGTLVVKTPNAKAAENWFYPYTVVGYARGALANNPPLGALLSPIRHPVWSCDPPRHLYSFTERSLLAAAERAGLSAGDCAIEFYRRPLFDASLTRLVRRKPSGARGVARFVAAGALVPTEWMLKAVQWSLTRIDALPPSGLILRVAAAHQRDCNVSS